MKKNRGFALIELLVVLALLGMVITVIFLPIANSFKTFGVQNEKTNVISDARNAMAYLTKEIKKANSVEVRDNTLILNSIDYKSEGGAIFKDNKRVFEGNYQLFVEEKEDKKIVVEIVVTDSNDKEHKLSSQFNIRRE